MAGSKDENLNKGHRQRVKERYLSAGNLDSFQDYEVLEMMLFYVYPMKDTKPAAKRLINIFGSLHNVLNAEPEQLMKEAGLTLNAAVYISMFPHIMRQYTKSFYKKGVVVSDVYDAIDLFSGLLKAQSYESFYMVSLNAAHKVTSIDRIGDGTADEVTLSSEIILKRALLNNASFVIIGHNHPAGICEPSGSDYAMTGSLKKGFESIGVILIDHIIICGNKNYSFAKDKYFGLTYDV